MTCQLFRVRRHAHGAPGPGGAEPCIQLQQNELAGFELTPAGAKEMARELLRLATEAQRTV